MKLTRHEYASYYGPTAGDRIRLGDTALVAEIERDCTVLGDENIYAGGRSLRDAMGLTAAAANALDSVVINAIIIDWTGILKGDIGIKDGRIVGIGKAGNPDFMDGVTPGLIIGSATEIVSAEGLIATAGAVDGNVAFVGARQVESALSGGITTLLGGGSGMASDFESDAGTPGARRIETLMRATDDLPVNLGFYARAGSPGPVSLAEQITGGAAGMSLHEFWGTGAAAVENCLAASIQYDLPVTLHLDALIESGGWDALLKTLKGRPVCIQLDMGAGGGNAQDGLRACAEGRALPVSTGSARPSSVSNIEAQREALFARRRMNRNDSADAEFAEAVAWGPGLAAEDILHDLGAIPAVNSGAMASGRPGDMLARVWRTAHKMSQQRGRLPGESGHNDNIRIRRYLAKYTINPAILAGIAHETGSIESGKLADIVLWKPAFFGIKPECVLKGGIPVWGQAGVAGAGLPLIQPVLATPGIGGRGASAADTSLVFVSKQSIRQNALANYNLRKKVAPVRGWRRVSKAEMRLNEATPKIGIDLKRNTVLADGEMLVCEPAECLPLAQRYALF